MGKIKICFVSPFAYPLFNSSCDATFGGSEVQLYHYATEFAKDKKFSVSFVVSDFGQKDLETYNNISVYKSFSTKKTLYNYFYAFFRMYSVLKKINPDIIIQRGASPETGLCGFFCRVNKKKFIYSVAHEIDVNNQYAKKFLLGSFYMYGIKSAEYVVLQNSEQRNLFYQWCSGKLRNNSTIIQSGYPIKSYSITNKKYVLWVARSDKWKQPELYIKLAKKIPNQKFVMIMPKSADVATYNSVMDSLKTAKNISFFNRVAFKDIQEYFNNAKIFVNTSESEGFPNTFVQSCLATTPIVSLNVNPNNFLSINKCGYFCENDFNLLVRNTKKLLQDKKLLSTYSENAHSYVKKNHDLKNTIKCWKKVVYTISSQYK